MKVDILDNSENDWSCLIQSLRINQKYKIDAFI